MAASLLSNPKSSDMLQNGLVGSYEAFGKAPSPGSVKRKAGIAPQPPVGLNIFCSSESNMNICKKMLNSET